jgi:hypothetical protein
MKQHAPLALRKKMLHKASTLFFRAIVSWNDQKRALTAAVALACVVTWPRLSSAQLDICQCAGHPDSLGAFNSRDQTTYPPGTTLTFDSSFAQWVIRIPLPEDGTLIFDSVTLNRAPNGGGVRLEFIRNSANTAAKLLVAGDVLVTSGDWISVNGENGRDGLSSVNGQGGLGGPGGFRGGDGAYQLVNFAHDGGAGFGPSGGSPGTSSPLTAGGNGAFMGARELVSLVGGSGGGGGASSGNVVDCSGSGGGGGGGAILISSNGTISLNGQITAAGGCRGRLFSSCASHGGNGSGGAIRLVAGTIAGTGSLNANLYSCDTNTNPGAIRLEAFTNTLSASSTFPVATRSPVPGPVTNPLTPTVAITSVNGQTTSIANGEPLATLPQGGFGAVDVLMSSPGVANIELATTAVPAGTTVEVTAKPRVGGPPVSMSTTLDPGNCDSQGNCIAEAAFALPSGAYVIEARATFQTP